MLVHSESTLHQDEIVKCHTLSNSRLKNTMLFLQFKDLMIVSGKKPSVVHNNVEVSLLSFASNKAIEAYFVSENGSSAII